MKIDDAAQNRISKSKQIKYSWVFKRNNEWQHDSSLDWGYAEYNTVVISTVSCHFIY